MIHFFRRNLFFNSLMLLPYCILLRAGSFFSSITSLDVSSHCTTYWESAINQLIPNSILQAIIAVILIFLQGAHLNHIVNKHRMTVVATLLPGMIYIMLTSIFLENLTLTQYTVGNGLSLLAISNFMAIYKKYKPETEFFMSGFWLSFACICSPIYGLLIIPLIVAFISLRTFNLKELLQITVGGISGGIIVASIHYFINTEGLKQLYITQHFTEVPTISNLYVLGFLGFILLMILMSIFSFQKFQIKKSLPVKKKLAVMYAMLASSIGIITMSCSLNLNSLYYMLIPIAYFMSMLVIHFRKLMIGEIIHTICIVLIINNHFNFYSFL